MSEVREITLSTDKVLAHITNKIGHVIFNNPERYNAVSLEMWDAVEEALLAFSKEPHQEPGRPSFVILLVNMTPPWTHGLNIC